MKTAEATLLCRNFPFVSLIEPLKISKLNRSTFESNKILRDNALIIMLSHFFDEDYTEKESCEHFNDTRTNPSVTILNIMFVFVTKCFVRHHFKLKPLHLLLARAKCLYIRVKHMVELER